ncbi:MAG TPA: hypothetical protein VI229_00290 [Burkholderiales bacterium]
MSAPTKVGQAVQVIDRRDGAVVMKGEVVEINVDIDDRSQDTATVRGRYVAEELQREGEATIRVSRLCCEVEP